MSEKLLQSKRFLPLLLTQFTGALNDNLFKNSLLTMVALKMTDKADVLSNVIAGLFIFPFFLFSATAGEIADKYARDKIARILKAAEFLLMCVAAFVFWQKCLALLIVLLALMGTQSAFFGPIKYALLPQLLKKDELVFGNACVEASTYIAILLGLILGTLLPIPMAICTLLFLSAAGFVAAKKIPFVPASRPDAVVSINVFKAISATLRIARRNPVVFKSILGATWFWTVGALVAVQIYPLSASVLNASSGVITFFLILFSLGVAIGSFTCSKILNGMLHATFVPLSALGMGVALFFLYSLTANLTPPALTLFFNKAISDLTVLGIAGSLFALAFFGGMFVVPLNALMQYHAPKKYTATIIAANNILNALGMAFSALAAIILLKLGVSVQGLFLCAAGACLVVFFYISALLPDALLRSIFQTVLKIFYRVNITGLSNLKKAGRRCLIIANHTSLLDGLLIAAFMPEKIMFAINTEWAKKWYVKPFGLLVHLFPINPASPLSLRAMIEEVKKNKKVMIFPEGRISITGGLMKVYEGAGVIALRAGAPILPVRISGAEFSRFSYLKQKLKTRFFPHIKMYVQPPEYLEIPENLKGRHRRRAISMKLYTIMSEMMYKTSPLNENIFTSLLASAAHHGWNHKIAEDISRRPLSYNALIRKAYILGTAYKEAFGTEKYLGLMLPNTLANVVSFYALIAADMIPVMMNFSQGIPQVLSSAQTVGLKTIITSRLFVIRAKLSSLVAELTAAGIKIIYLEEFAKSLSLKVKIKGFIGHLQCRAPIRTAAETAVVLFTSGSEGMPKAVLLSHKNLQANRYQITSVLALNSTDVFFNALPMFHSFGLSIGTILTILSGIKTFFYPSPLHYRVVPELVYDTNTTIICGTDTFFFGYGRMANPYDFFNLKYAVVGGEKLKDATRDLWIEKFGVRILEGYGATETSPVLTLNTPMYIKKGSVGRLLPGITHKLVPLPGVDEGAKLVVSGENIMQGYMRKDHPGQLEALQDRWYDTGDIVTLDEDGFITILGRAKRFAKIAGEMVSLTAVEAVLDKLYPGALQGIVTLPDEKKGERLVLITNNEETDAAVIKAFFRQQGLSELWRPQQIIFMAKPPVLGTGKFDYSTAQKMLLEEQLPA